MMGMELYHKGVSGVVAAVLLIAIALILLVSVSSWLTVLTQDSTTTITNSTSEFVNCAASGIVIEDVYMDFSSNLSRVSVRNTGRNTENIVSAQLLNTNGQAAPLNSSLPNLTVGDIKAVVFNINGTITTCSNFSQVRVASSCASDTYKQRPNNC